MLATTISEQIRSIAAVANISGISLHSSHVVLACPALWKVNPVASLDVIRLRLSVRCEVGQHKHPQDPVRSFVESHDSHQDE